MFLKFIVSYMVFAGANAEYSQLYDANSLQPEHVECITVYSKDGILTPSAANDGSTCGLYLVGELDTQVEIEFQNFEVECQTSSLVAILDGWEHGGSVFPPLADISEKARSNRYSTFCGPRRPPIRFVSSGNMALIQYKLGALDNFVVKITFTRHNSPCNMVVVGSENEFTLKNYGLRRNCSALIITPQILKITVIDVGSVPVEFDNGSPHLINPSTKMMFLPIVPRYQAGCQSDYVEYLGGSSWSLKTMELLDATCGNLVSQIMNRKVMLCEAVMVRLISSGKYENAVVFQHENIVEETAEHSGLQKEDVFICEDGTL